MAGGATWRTRRGSTSLRWRRKGVRRHSVWHAVAEEGIPLKAIVGVVAARLGVPVVSVAPGSDEATAHLRFLAYFVGADGAASSATTRELLGWQPKEAGPLADMEAFYFRAAPPS